MNLKILMRQSRRQTGMSFHEKSRKKPSECNPGTTVYKLVEELRGYVRIPNIKNK